MEQEVQTTTEKGLDERRAIQIEEDHGETTATTRPGPGPADTESTRRPGTEGDYMGFRVASISDPAIIPVPDAVLLGSIGLGLAGLKLRKRNEL